MISSNFKKSLAFLNEAGAEDLPAQKSDAGPGDDLPEIVKVMGQEVRWNPDTKMWHGESFTLDDATVRMLLAKLP